MSETATNSPLAPQAIQTGDSHEIAWDIARRSPPRDLMQIWTDIESELKFAPEYASKAWYSIPYKDSNGKQVPVEGTGVHGATVMARHYGHCSFGGGILSDDGDKVICRGIFKDHKTNVDSYKEIIVHRFQTARTGKTYRLAGKHWDNAIQSGISKAMRNAILHGLPEVIKSRFFNTAKKLTIEDKSPGTRSKSLGERIDDVKIRLTKAFGVQPEIIDEYIADLTGVEGEQELLTHLIGLGTALKSGEATVQEVFGVDPVGKNVMSKPKEASADESPL